MSEHKIVKDTRMDIAVQDAGINFILLGYNTRAVHKY